MKARTLTALVRGIAVVAVTWCLAMALFSALPGDAARTLAGPQASQADVARVRERLALDAPLWARLAARARTTLHRPGAKAGVGTHADCTDLAVVHVDLGRSYVYRRTVAELVATRLPASLALALATACMTLTMGAALGFAGAFARRSHVTASARVVSALPAYAVGLALHELFARRLGLLPIESSLASATLAARAAVLPVVTLTLAMVGPYVALARDRWRALAREPFVLAAVARGMSRRRALWRHGRRQVLGELLALACIDAGALVGGSVLTERLFRWPGLGSLAIEALLGRDVPTLGGVVLVGAAAVAIASTAGEWARAATDPRLDDGS